MNPAEELRALARNAMKKSGGDPRQAARALADIVGTRAELLAVLILDYLSRIAPERSPERPAVDVRDYDVKKYRRRSPAQRAAALRAASEFSSVMATAYQHKIDGRDVGDLSWGELTRLREQLGIQAASYLRLGTDEVVNLLLLEKLQAHGQVSDHSSKVADNVTEQVVQRYLDESIIEAPDKISYFMRAVRNAMDTPVPLALGS